MMGLPSRPSLLTLLSPLLPSRLLCSAFASSNTVQQVAPRRGELHVPQAPPRPSLCPRSSPRPCPVTSSSASSASGFLQRPRYFRACNASGSHSLPPPASPSLPPSLRPLPSGLRSDSRSCPSPSLSRTTGGWVLSSRRRVRRARRAPLTS
jgi:hypothetical protein